MKTYPLLYSVVFFLLVLLVSEPSAAIRPWEIDKEYTNFYFSVDHIYSKVQGRFTEYEGTILFDPDNLSESKISFEIKVKSIDTDIRKRDRHLRSEDFFDASTYPVITFFSNSISAAGENMCTITGTLAIKDVTSEISFPLKDEGKQNHPFVKGSEVAGFNGRLFLDRLNYNVGDGKYYTMGAVGKDVDILVTIEALREK